jgi:23S rRNA pseudouridine1911/1915/1917 synthase
MDSILPCVKRQQLHAEKLGFVHPDSGDYCEFNAPLPDDMRSVLEALRRMERENEEHKKIDKRQ